MINGDEATFKRIERRIDGVTIHPLNPSYPPRTFSNIEVRDLPVRIIGVAKELRRKA